MLTLKKRSQKDSSLLPDSKDILPLCFFALAGLYVLLLFFVTFMAFRVNQLAQRKTTFIQLVDGRPLVVSEQEYLYRYPEVVKNTVRQWATLTFNWDGVIPGTQEPDKGRKVGNNKRVTTNAYFASFLIQAGPDGFRQPILEAIADITPPRLFSGQVRSKIIISFLSAPRQTRPGEWEVDMVSTRVLVNLEGGADEEIPFNRTVTLRAVDIPAPPSSDASALEKRIYEIRSAGLEITKISELNLSDK